MQQPRAFLPWERTSTGSTVKKSRNGSTRECSYLVSPLDTANMTEVELTEEQETVLGWLDRNQVQHVRVVE